jgi:hypothetical protein
MVESNFGKTTVQQVGISNVDQGDVSSGLLEVSAGLLKVAGTAERFAAIEQRNQINADISRANREGEAAGSSFDAQGRPIAPNIADNIDPNSIYGNAYINSALNQYGANVRAAADNKARELAAKYPTSAASFEAAFNDYKEDVLGEVHPDLAEDLRGDITSIGQARRSDVVANEEKLANANAESILRNDLGQALELGNTLTAQGDFENADKTYEQARTNVQQLLEAGYMLEGEAEQALRQIDLSRAVEQAFVPVSNAFNRSDLAGQKERQLAAGFAEVEALGEKLPSQLGLKSEAEKRLLLDELRNRTIMEGERRLAVQRANDAALNRDRYNGGEEANRRLVNGNPLSEAEARDRFNRGKLPLENYLRAASREQAARDAIINEVTRNLIWEVENGVQSWGQAVGDPAFQYLTPAQHFALRDSVVERANDAIRRKSHVELEAMMVNHSIPVALVNGVSIIETVLRAAAANGTITPEQFGSKLKAYYTSYEANVGKAALLQNGYNTIGQGLTILDKSTLNAVDKSFLYNPRDPESQMAAGDLMRETGNALPSMVEALDMAVGGGKVSEIVNAAEQYGMVCNATNNNKAQKNCVALGKKVKPFTEEVLRAVSLLDPGTLGEEYRARVEETFKQVSAMRQGNESGNRRLDKYFEGKSFDEGATKYLRHNFEYFADKSEGIWDEFVGAIAPVWFMASRIDEEFAKEIQLAQAEGIDMVEFAAAPPPEFEQAVVDRMKAKILTSPSGEKREVAQLALDAATEVMQENYVHVRKVFKIDDIDVTDIEQVVALEFRPGRNISSKAKRKGNVPEGLDVNEKFFADHARIFLTKKGLTPPGFTKAKNWQEVNVELVQQAFSVPGTPFSHDTYEIHIIAPDGEASPLKVRDRNGRVFIPTIEADFKSTIQGQYYASEYDKIAEGDAGGFTNLLKQIPLVGDFMLNKLLEYDVENYMQQIDEYKKGRRALEVIGLNTTLSRLEAGTAVVVENGE